MKTLFYKELKLAFHPVIWFFITLFPLMILIPSYPAFISFIYVLAVYPILFLGANKGQQSNDIVYSCLLPIKRGDVIKARIMSLIFIQVINIAVTCALAPLADFIKHATLPPEKSVDIGLGTSAFGSVIAFVLIAFAIYDLLFLVFFYRNGRSVLLPTLLGILLFSFICVLFIIILPYSVPGYIAFFSNIWTQVVSVIVGLVIYVLIHLLGYKVAKKEFEKVDF